MWISESSRTGRRAARWALVGCCLVVSGCSDDSNTPDDGPPGTLADEEVLDQQPGVPNDVNDGSGEGGNRSGEGDEAPGTP